MPAKSVVFLGEMDLDANRRHIVRLRGYFAVVGGTKSRFDILKDLGLQGVAYIEAVNAEVDGQFWLPAQQRFEAVASAATVGEGRAIFRILTRFIDRRVLPMPEDVVAGSAEDTLAIHPFRLAIESPDSLSRYKGWHTELGEMTAEVSAEDFDDVAPDRWNPKGKPRVAFETARLGDVFHVNRVQGVFTGVGAVARFRDAAPGLTMRVAAGWAWNEETARGRFVTEYRRGPTEWSARVSRSLDITSDFRNPFDSGSTLAALLGRDNYDYVDRRSAMLQWLRFLGSDERTQFRIEAGPAEDRAAVAHLTRSPLGIGYDFRANRPVREGRYARTVIMLDTRPDVSLEFLRTGAGARFVYERGDGELRYQRIEGRFTVRSNRGPFSLGARLDLGATTPGAPPQQFFEIGQNQNLPGYEYKEFAGDQTAMFRVLALRRLPLLGAPIRITPRIWLPPLAPAIALGVQAGWTRASTPEALATTTLLGSVPTGHPRASASLTLRFLGGAVGAGIATPLDHSGHVRWYVEFGQRP